MALIPFQQSDALSIGVELELQLINLSNFDLSASSPDVLHLLGKHDFPGGVTPEITESMIEICTDVQNNYNSLLTQLQTIRDALVNAADTLNLGICGGGTHPFQRWSERKIFSKQRFEEVSALYGYLAKQFTVFGQHIHIGCNSSDDALFLLHSLSRYVPHFIALSASSPYVQGNDTLFHSARLNSVFAFPLSGRAPFILNWREFSENYFVKMEKTGVIKSMKDFYWDIRPKPEYGTIELRVCDTPLTVERAAALAAYLQMLCAYLLERKESEPVEDDYLVYNYNRFQACRFGLDGEIVHPKTYETRSLREDILATLSIIAPFAESLGALSAMTYLYKATGDETDAQFLRRQYDESGSVEGMVNAALGQFRNKS
jgi:glutamate---cysteine ligase / carboxylate-amine ligase